MIMRATTISNRLLALFVSFIAIPLSTTTVARGAPPLAEQAPADTLVYVGWAGADALKPAFDESHFAAVLNETNLQALIEQYLPWVWSPANGFNDPAQAAAAKQVMTILWHHPSVWYMRAM